MNDSVVTPVDFEVRDSANESIFLYLFCIFFKLVSPFAALR